MATPVVQTNPERHVSRSAERVLFCTVAVMIVATVLLGFAKTYFLAGVFAAKLPSALVQIHGAVFTSWVGLLTTQSS